MATAPRMKMEEQQTKRSGETTKRSGETTKRIAETREAYSNSGGDGDYMITTPDGEKIPIDGAITIRVLAHGELNLVTDTGRWFLFAPGTWKTAFPKQPEPGGSDVG
jgi:hypothetical protein